MATESTEEHGKIKSINLIEQTAYDHDTHDGHFV